MHLLCRNRARGGFISLGGVVISVAECPRLSLPTTISRYQGQSEKTADKGEMVPPTMTRSKVDSTHKIDRQCIAEWSQFEGCWSTPKKEIMISIISRWTRRLRVSGLKAGTGLD